MITFFKYCIITIQTAVYEGFGNIIMYFILQGSLEMSLEEQYATEDTKDEEEENNTGNEMDNKENKENKEEGDVEMMDTSVPQDTKGESMNGKLSAIMYVRCHFRLV